MTQSPGMRVADRHIGGMPHMDMKSVKVGQLMTACFLNRPPQWPVLEYRSLGLLTYLFQIDLVRNIGRRHVPVRIWGQ